MINIYLCMFIWDEMDVGPGGTKTSANTWEKNHYYNYPLCINLVFLTIFFLIVLLQCSKISVSITLCIINVSLFIYPFLNLPFFSYHLCPKWHRHPPDWVRILRNNWIPLSLSVLISSLVSHRFCLHRSS